MSAAAGIARRDVAATPSSNPNRPNRRNAAASRCLRCNRSSSTESNFGRYPSQAWKPLLRGQTDRLRLEVLLETGRRPCSRPETALLVTTEGRVGPEPLTTVHRHRTGAHPPGDPERTVERAARDRTREAVSASCWRCARRRRRRRGDDGEHRAEDLLLGGSWSRGRRRRRASACTK